MEPSVHNSNTVLDRLRRISADPRGYAESIKTAGDKPFLGYFCSYTPEEMIVAAGAVPFRIFGQSGDILQADAHLQSYCCSLVRGGLEGALGGRLNFLEGAVFPHTCDSIQRLSDIWRLNAGMKLHFDVVLPVKLTTESARTYMIDVLREFRNDLETAFDAPISDEQIHGAIQTCNRVRALLEKLYKLRSRNPQVLSASDMYHVTKAAMVMERESLAEELQNLYEVLEKAEPPSSPKERKRLLITGGVCNHPDIYDLIETAGADVVWDDLCTGTRYFQARVDEEGDPIGALADRYMARMVCPAKHSGTTARGEHLKRLAADKRIDGAVFLLLKFCDPHGFDYPYLKSFLEEEGVPTLLLEVEEQLPSEAQLRTRFETFVDML